MFESVEEHINYVAQTEVLVTCGLCGKLVSDRDTISIQVEEGKWETYCINSCNKTHTKEQEQ